jgi:two-component system chemotaxis response regulator CheB
MGEWVPLDIRSAASRSGASACFVNAAYDLVVVAGSAGGIAAARDMLAEIPPDFPAPIALVQHLSPHYPSRLDKVLGGSTRLSVRFAEHGERLRAGTVHLAPPDHHLLIGPNRRLVLSSFPRINGTRPAADPLFESSAATFGSRTLAVILSGTGQDGARGVRAIRDADGTVMVQDPVTADGQGMPTAAIRTGATHFVLPPVALASALVALVMKPGAAALFGAIGRAA